MLDFSLCRVTFLSTSEKIRLSNQIESAEKFCSLTVQEISELCGRQIPQKVSWNGAFNLHEAKRQLEACIKLKIGVLKITESEYPCMLNTISNPPFLLFYRGDLSAFSMPSVSVVGTRRLSPEGKKAAFEFAKDAAQKGVCVVSGLARGADGFAHKGSVDAYFDLFEKTEDKIGLEKLGKTIAVLPCNIDQISPAMHVKLAENILKTGGVLISEYAPFTDFGNWHFVQRNRIIAALSPATVVIEAPNGSGALITVDFALELGRDVMFHQVCFCENAKKINEGVKKNLENEYNNKKITKHKLEVSSEQFVQDGAPVIKDFEDYCRCLAEMPGTRNIKIKQLELFDK